MCKFRRVETDREKPSYFYVPIFLANTCRVYLSFRKSLRRYLNQFSVLTSQPPRISDNKQQGVSAAKSEQNNRGATQPIAFYNPTPLMASFVLCGTK